MSWELFHSVHHLHHPHPVHSAYLPACPRSNEITARDREGAGLINLNHGRIMGNWVMAVHRRRSISVKYDIIQD